MPWLFDKLSQYGDRPAWAQGGRVFTSAQVLERTMALGGWLREQGVRPGQVVALVADYSMEALAAFLALYANHNVIVPITGQPEAEVKSRLDNAYVDWSLAWPEGAPELTAWPAREPHPLIAKLQEQGRAGLMLFSSGSTGKPKVMVHDLENLVDSYQGRKARRLNILIFLLFDHIGGLNTLLNALVTGALAVVPEKRDPEDICRLIAQHQVHILPSSPTFLNLMLLSGAHERHDLSSLRLITYGTEAMPEGLLVKLRGALPKARLLQTFGTSETGIVETMSKSSDSLLIKLKDANIEYKVVDGELWLRSKVQVLGYLDAGQEQDKFTDDGWFKTGDLVEEDGEGYVKIVGRTRELINVGGMKVLPLEVESVLMALPEVSDCLVHGQPNPITGQTVVAEIVSSGGLDRRALLKLVRKACLEKMEAYKVPTKVIPVAEIPVSNRFKKQRRNQG